MKAYIDDYNVIEKVRTIDAPSHFTEGKPTYRVHAPQSEDVFHSVFYKAKDIGMQVNADKTQLLCIRGGGEDLRTYIRTEEGRLTSGERLKILGFSFGRTPDVSVNTSELINRFNSNMWALQHLKRSGMANADLLHIYKVTIRPAIEYASAAYHCLLTKEQSNSLERLQLRTMKTVFGDLVSYGTVIDAGLIEPLCQRREENFKKFALKTSKNSRFDHWFPKNVEVNHNLRRRERYFIPRLNTERAMKSPIIQMRRYLNTV